MELDLTQLERIVDELKADLQSVEEMKARVCSRKPLQLNPRLQKVKNYLSRK